MRNNRAKVFFRCLWFFSISLLLTWLIFGATDVRGATMRLFLKDGRVYVGAIHPMKSVIEMPLEQPKEKAGVQTEKILLIDDQLRRIYVPKNAVLDMTPDEISASLEVFRFPQRTNKNPRQQIALLGAFRQSTPFDEFGRRTINVGGNPVVQAITRITPQYIQAEGVNFNIDMRLSPYSVPRAKLSELIKKEMDPKNLNERLRIYQFYVQAELYEQATEELMEIMRDFQGEGEGAIRPELQTALVLIRQLAATRLIEELELLQRSGQSVKVRKLLESFEAQGVSPEKVQTIRRMLAKYPEFEQKRTAILDSLAQCAEMVTEPELQEAIAPILEEIKRQLNENTINRFSEFQLALQDISLEPSAKLAIALSCWLGGNQAADSRLEIVASMYKVRRLVRRFLLEKIANEREQIWKEIEAQEASTPQRMAQILRVMQPPRSTQVANKQTPGFYELKIDLFNGQSVPYYVQLPPEYDPNIKYPAVIALHGERTTAKMQIDWWCGGWTAAETAGETPRPERTGHATRNGYIVIAPVWGESGIGYHYSATDHAAVLMTMRDALRRFSIDTDRIFLSGHSAGGNAAWDIGLSHPDLWAGVIPICGSATKYAAALKRNAQYVPIYAIGGELDGGSLNLSQEVLDWGMDLSKPFDMTYVQFKGRGNESFSDELSRIFDWMGLRERNFYSKEEKTVYSLRPWDNFFWMVELDQFPKETMTDPDFWTTGKLPVDRPAKTEFFKVVANSLKIKSSAQVGIVFLSPELLDFNQKAEVLFNTRKLSPANGTIVPSVRVMLEDVRTRGDRQHPFWATLESDHLGKLNRIEAEQ